MKAAFVSVQTIPRPKIQTCLWNLELCIAKEGLDLKSTIGLIETFPMFGGLVPR